VGNPDWQGQGVNQSRLLRRSLSDLMQIDSTVDLHRVLFEHSLDRYRALCDEQGRGLGTLLALGATDLEAQALSQHPFDEILLTGIIEPNERLCAVMAADSRVRYEKQNAERLTIASRSFDLVYCKETLHHLARPVLGFYEVLRVCREAALIMEPFDTHLDRLLNRLGLTTVYETEQLGNLQLRDNFVYRWDRKRFEYVLNSLYLESGYSIEMTVGWLSARYNCHPSPVLRRISALAGWLLGFVPGSRGNYVTALIVPGSDLPPDPNPA